MENPASWTDEVKRIDAALHSLIWAYDQQNAVAPEVLARYILDWHKSMSAGVIGFSLPAYIAVRIAESRP